MPESFYQTLRIEGTAMNCDCGNRQVDVRIHGGLGMYQIEPVSQAAKDWVNENVQSEGWQWLGNRLGVDDGRLVANIVEGMQSDGLTVE